MVNPQTWANAVKPGQWGYFYEDTCLDLYLTPEYELGEVIAHDAKRKSITLQVAMTTYLQGGLHPYRFEVAGEPGRNRFTWMYPDGRAVDDLEDSDASNDKLPLRMYRPLPTQLFHEAR